MTTKLKLSFDEWMSTVDKIAINATSMSIHDLPDMRFRDSYDNGESPESFAEDNLGIKDGKIVDYSILRDLIMG